MKKVETNELDAIVGGAGVPLPRPRPFGDVDSLGNFVPGRANLSWNDLSPTSAEADASTRSAAFLAAHPQADLVAFNGQTTNGNFVMGSYSRQDLNTDQIRASTGQALGYDGYIGRDASGNVVHERPDTVSFGGPSATQSSAGAPATFDERFNAIDNGGTQPAASSFDDRFHFGSGQGDGGATRGLGSSGNDGFSGASGNDGFFGSSGNDGFSGSSGNDGFSGSSGNDGFSGSSGNDGFSGSSGNDGFSGSSGNDGFSGSSGFDGSSGSSGFDGGSSNNDSGFSSSSGGSDNFDASSNESVE